MTAPFYVQSGAPKPDASGLSSAMRKEFLSIEEGMEEANLFGLTQLMPDINRVGGVTADQLALFAAPFDLRVVGFSWVVTGNSSDGTQIRVTLSHLNKGSVQWAGQSANQTVGCILRAEFGVDAPAGSIAYEGINDTDAARADRGQGYIGTTNGSLGTNAVGGMMTLWVKRI